jgi:hypothetical protein
MNVHYQDYLGQWRLWLSFLTNKPIDHRVRAQNHDHKYKSKNGFHIDGSINGSLATYIQNCGLSNILAERHAKSGAEIPNTHLRGPPNTHLRGPKQINIMLATPGIEIFMPSIGLLDFDVIFRTDHRTFFINIDMEGLFGSTTESFPAQPFRQLQLEY